jgi:4-hydroxy-2-oxoheptanedioate aldolase
MTTTCSLPHNPLKQALAERRPQIGIWLTLGTTNTTEVLAGSGYDWLLIDMEHTCTDAAQVLELLRAATGGTAEPVVRIPWRDTVLMKRLLDAGVRSFMVPFVQTAEEARDVVSATRYPPEGVRGVNGAMRASLYGRVPEYGKRCAEEICVIVQAETPLALANAASIGAVDGVDAVFIGPNDLAANMGYYGRPGDPHVKSAIQEAFATIAASGAAAGILNFNVEEARSYLKSGVSLIAVGSDVGILARKSEELRQQFDADFVGAGA